MNCSCNAVKIVAASCSSLHLHPSCQLVSCLRPALHSHDQTWYKKLYQTGCHFWNATDKEGLTRIDDSTGTYTLSEFVQIRPWFLEGLNA